MEPIKLYEISERYLFWLEETALGDAEVYTALLTCLEKFLARYSCVFIDKPAPGFQALVRIFRSAAILTDQGTVKSTELFTIRRLALFIQSHEERRSTLNEANWDNKATLFLKQQPSRRTRDIPPLIDYDGSGVLVRGLESQIKQFEILVNNQFHGKKEKNLVLSQTEIIGNWRKTTIDPCLPLRQEIRTSFELCLKEEIAEQAKLVLTSFRNCLSQVNLAAMAGCAVNTVRSYNWLQGIQHGKVQDKLGVKRVQAVQAYPFAWEIICKPIGLETLAIEQGLPLAPLLASTLGISEAVLKKMNGLSVIDAGHNQPLTENETARVGRRVERIIGKAPKSSIGWQAFFAAVCLVENIESMALRANDREKIASGLLASSSDKWDAWQPENLADLKQVSFDFRDLARDFHANVGEPIARSLGRYDWTEADSARYFLGNRSLAQISSASHWWHQNQVEIRARLANLYPVGKGYHSRSNWPALHQGEWRATNGLLVIALNSEEKLVDEHNHMSHCVNTYTSKCLYSGSHILSVRSSIGDRYGTAEIMQKILLPLYKSASEPPNAPLTNLPPATVQFRAKGNLVPELKAWEALWEYVSAILTGKLEIQTEFLAASLFDREASNTNGRIAQDACYNTYTTGAIAEAWKCYATILSKSNRNSPRSLVEFIREGAIDPEPVVPMIGMR